MQQQPNWDLISRIIDRAKAKPKLIYMPAWLSIYHEDEDSHDFVGNRFGGDMLDELLQTFVLPPCNTAGCLVGTAVILEPEKASQIARDKGNELIAESIGVHLFGISYTVAGHLFYARNWPARYRAIADHEGDGAAVVALLQEALDKRSFDFLLSESERNEEELP